MKTVFKDNLDSVCEQALTKYLLQSIVRATKQECDMISQAATYITIPAIASLLKAQYPDFLYQFTIARDG